MSSEEGVEGGGGLKDTAGGAEDSSSGGRKERRGSGRDRRDRAPRGAADKREVSGETQEKSEDGRERRRGRGNRRRDGGKARDKSQVAAKSDEGSASQEKSQRGGRGRGGQGRTGQKRAPRPGRDARPDRGGNRRPDGGYRKREVSGRNNAKPGEQEEDLSTIDAAEIFKKAKELLKEDRLIDACKLFKRAHKAAPENPEYMSYCGLTSATGFGEIKLGLELCTRAIKYECNVPEFYINLAKVYIASGNKKGAIMAITKGTRYELGSNTLHQMLIDMGVRKQSLLPFMKRSSFINKGLGILFRRTLPGFKKRKSAGK